MSRRAASAIAVACALLAAAVAVVGPAWVALACALLALIVAVCACVGLVDVDGRIVLLCAEQGAGEGLLDRHGRALDELIARAGFHFDSDRDVLVELHPTAEGPVRRALLERRRDHLARRLKALTAQDEARCRSLHVDPGNQFRRCELDAGHDGERHVYWYEEGDAPLDGRLQWTDKTACSHPAKPDPRIAEIGRELDELQRGEIDG